MYFLIHSRAAAGPHTDDPELNDRHWRYTDAFVGGMTARGPTLASDRDTWTGSVHIVDLPDLDAARAFVEREPYQRAGRYGEHSVWHFDDLLGRTMWEFGHPPDDPRYLLIAAAGPRSPLPPLTQLGTPLRERLIFYGGLRAPGEAVSTGVAIALQAPSRSAAAALLRGERVWDGDLTTSIVDWEFGGRR